MRSPRAIRTTDARIPLIEVHRGRKRWTEGERALARDASARVPFRSFPICRAAARRRMETKPILLIGG